MVGAAQGKRILFLAPSFLADRRHKRIRGAEIFNLMLVRELVDAGASVTVATEGTWRANMAAHLGDLEQTQRLRLLYTPRLRRPLPASLAAAARLAFSPAFDLLIVGNVGRGVLPAVSLLRRLGKSRRTVVIAHQFPRESYPPMLRGKAIEVMACCNAVADVFRAAGVERVETCFGIQNAADYHPAPPGSRPDDGRVHFCILGVLDSPIKGADIAIEAWSLLPERLRRRAILHLCAYKTPPVLTNPDIVTHEWMPHEAIGDFLRRMDVVLVPSRIEAFATAMVQGMLCGLPVVCSQLPSLTERIDTGAGLAFADPAELARHVEQLTENAAERARMGIIARHTAVQRYIWSFDRFAGLYLKP